MTASALDHELGVSERTIYRDVATLIAQGAPIEGEAGLGYVLRPGFVLPPLMFGEEEIEALALGLHWVVERGDAALARAAGDALAKVTAVLPEALREKAEDASLLAGPGEAIAVGSTDLSELRRVIREERKLAIRYADAAGRLTERTIWPCALAFFERARVIVAWCELRQGFRHFRTDRIHALTPSATRYPRRRRVLLKEWRKSMGMLEG